MSLEAVGQDRVIKPFPTIHAAPGRIPHPLRYFQEQRVGKGRHHQSLAASADPLLHCATSVGTVHVFHAGLPLIDSMADRMYERCQRYEHGLCHDDFPRCDHDRSDDRKKINNPEPQPRWQWRHIPSIRQLGSRWRQRRQQNLFHEACRPSCAISMENRQS